MIQRYDLQNQLKSPRKKGGWSFGVLSEKTEFLGLDFNYLSCKEYWGFGVRHIQLLLLVSCSIIDHMIISGLNAAIMMVESEVIPNSNYTLYEDAFKTTVKGWTYLERNRLSLSVYYTQFVAEFAAGYFTTRYNLKILLLCFFAVLSVQAYVIPSLAGYYSYQTLYVVRMLQGLFHGSLLPVISAIIAKWIPYNELSRSMSMIMGGKYVGQFMVLLLGKFLQTSVGGWSSLFYITGNIGILWCVAWFTFGFQDPHHCFYISNEEKFYIDKLTFDIQSAGVLKVPWKLILYSLPVWSLVLEAMFSIWVYEFVENPRFIQAFITRIHNISDYEAVLFIHLIPLIFVAQQVIVATVVDILITRETFPIIHIRKTCHTIGLWGGGCFLVYLGYVRTGIAALFCYHGFIFCSAFANVGALVNHFDLSPNFVGLLLGISRGAGYFLLVPFSSFHAYMIPQEAYEIGWDNMYYLSALSLLVGNYIYIITAKDELQKFNAITHSHMASSTTRSTISTGTGGTL